MRKDIAVLGIVVVAFGLSSPILFQTYYNSLYTSVDERAGWRPPVLPFIIAGVIIMIGVYLIVVEATYPPKSKS